VAMPYSPNARRVMSMASYNGSVATYRTSFTVAAGDYAVRFESVNHRARVWIDGHEVARHTGAYLPFEARVALGAGRHSLTVRADWRSPHRMRDEGWFRSWFNFGGITREVTIRRLRASELDAPGVWTRAGLVTVRVRVRNRSAERELGVAGTLGRTPLRFPRVRLPRGGTAWVTARVRVTASSLWSPSLPVLVPLRLSVPGESGYSARVGLREISVRRGRLYLNGHRLVLRGASIQEDAPGRGEALTGADMDAIVARLKRIGANATRAQHTLSPALLERFDAAGILVWQGIGVSDVPGRWSASTAAARARAVRRVRLDVLNNRAHPSIVAWNLVNELRANGATPAQASYVVAGARVAHRLDPGRPVAVDIWGTHLPSRPGRLYRSLDVIGATNYEGWYANLFASGAVVRANIRTWLARVHALFPDKPLVITEFGAEALSRNPTDSPGGLRFQARRLAEHLAVYRADPRVDGMIVWSLDDFALRPNFLGGSVRGLDPGISLQRGINAKGLFTYGGRAKPSVDVVAKAFG
jgi:beta-galactosidase/beta-glucuronidase